MGYAIAIRSKNKKLHERMKSFMEANFVAWHVIAKDTKLLTKDYSAGSFSESPPYDSAKTALGFHYNSWIDDYERHYLWTLTKWMSVQVGKKSKGKYYIVHDGDERFEFDQVLEPYKSQWKVIEQTTIGLPKFAGSVFASLTKGKGKKIDTLLKNELERLDNLWNQSEGV